ncbi:MAG: hypothetical protein DRN20_04565 [Thermoplasmata archaeon]|nr:MAG: hypothetical protein DRN20_04565 [Thermoplasmata archaeon]
MKHFIDREEELKKLRDLFGDVVKGRGELVLISGEKGVGKRALVTEFRRKIGDSAIFMEYYATPGVSVPYGAILSMIKGFEGDAVVEALSLLERARKIQREDLGKERDRLFSSVLNALLYIAKDKPAILVFGNMQFMDTDTLQLFRYLVNGIKNAPIMIIGTYAPEELQGEEHPLAMMMAEMAMEVEFTTITLDRFDKQNTGRLIAKTLGVVAVPDYVVDVIFDSTGGNPMFTVEVVKSLMSSGKIEVKEGAVVLAVEEISLPSSIKGMLMERIECMSDEDIRVIKCASLVGNEFYPSIIADALGIKGEEVDDSLYHLVEARILVHDYETGKYRFYHPSFRQIIEESVGEEAKVLHEKIARMLEEKGAEDYVLSYHYFGAQDYEKASEYSCRAGKKALSLNSPSIAIQHFLMCVESCKKLGKDYAERLAEAHLYLGIAEEMCGGWKKAIENYEEAIKLGTEVGNDRIVADGYRYLGHIRRERGEWDYAKENYEKALEIAEKIAYSDCAADVARGIGKVLWRLGDYRGAINWLEKGIKEAERVKNDRIIAAILIDMGNVYGDLGDVEKAIDYHRKGIEIAKGVNEYAEIARGYNNMGEQYKHMGKLEKAIECYDECIESASKAGDIRTKGYGLSNSAECFAKLGNNAEAKSRADRALSIFTLLDEKYVISGVYMVYGIIAGNEGRWEEGEEWFKKALDILQHLGIKYDYAIVMYEFGRFYKKKGDYASAKEKFEKALAIFKEIGSDMYAEIVEKDIRDLPVG